MERMVIQRVQNGVRSEVGRSCWRKGDLSGRMEPSMDYGPPRVFLRAGDTPEFWPDGAPDPSSVRSIYGNRSECGEWWVAEFSTKHFGGPEIIVKWEDADAIAQALANSEARTDE